ncbi:hypothetical protein EVAR_63913_1 [Eumeta japonica]|uniref:Uncharacterized protein n=1 Tax=Eumeta variegata TaxID=151549 RepID=A0A4C2AF07_EUMVA|nr:hypothetical protein EVAR_63913_1 [Eumeta japonica]
MGYGIQASFISFILSKYQIVSFISSIVISATGILPLDKSARTGLDDVPEQEFFKAPPLLPYCTSHTLTMFRFHHQASNSRYSWTIQRFTFVLGSKIYTLPPPEGH